MEFPSADPKKLTSYMLHNQEEEMKRIADELHDGVAQTIYSVYMGLQHIRNFQENEALAQYTSEMIKLTETTLNDLRKISTELYPHTLDHFGIFSALKSYVYHHEQKLNFKMLLNSSGVEQRLPLGVERGIYRVSIDIIHYFMQLSKIKTAQIMVNWLLDEMQIEFQAKGDDQLEFSAEPLSISSIQKQIDILGGSYEQVVKNDDEIVLRLKFPF